MFRLILCIVIGGLLVHFLAPLGVWLIIIPVVIGIFALIIWGSASACRSIATEAREIKAREPVRVAEPEPELNFEKETKRFQKSIISGRY